MSNTQLIIEENHNTNEILNYIDVKESKCEKEIEKIEEEFDSIKIVRTYMEGKLQRGQDLSYDWIIKEPNISLINRSIVLDTEKINTIFNKRDLTCELKLLKLITEGDKHKDILINVPKMCRKLNRYPDILPYKHNTLFLEKELEIKAGQEDLAADDIMNNYVNASYVSGPLPDDDNLFIATQGPLQCTVESFWKMIVVKNIKLIIMLTNVLEENRNKCEIYWPVNDSTSITIGKYKITLETEVFILDKAIIQRNMVIESEPDNLRYNVTQLHVVCWADHSAPEEELGFKMIEMILSYVDDCRNSNKDSPIVVHCSAGLGRSGTFIAIYNLCRCLNILKQYNKNSKSKILPFFSVFNTVRKLREERFSMVTDSVQYKYIYQFVVEWIKRNYEF